MTTCKAKDPRNCRYHGTSSRFVVQSNPAARSAFDAAVAKTNTPRVQPSPPEAFDAFDLPDNESQYDDSYDTESTTLFDSNSVQEYVNVISEDWTEAERNAVPVGEWFVDEINDLVRAGKTENELEDGIREILATRI